MLTCQSILHRGSSIKCCENCHEAHWEGMRCLEVLRREDGTPYGMVCCKVQRLMVERTQ